MPTKTSKVNRKLKAMSKALAKRAGKIEARSVVVTDEWGHKRVVGGFGDVGGAKPAAGGRKAGTVVEEWQGVCGWNEQSVITLLTDFIDAQGLAGKLDERLREVAEVEAPEAE